MSFKKFTHLKILTVLCLCLIWAVNTEAQTVTKTFNASGTVQVDGGADYGTNVTTLNFTSSDFTNGCEVSDVNVMVRFAKTDNTCASPGTGNSFHAETSFRLVAPDGTQVILAQPGTWTGSATMSLQNITFDQQAGSVAGGSVPSTGSYRPNNGNLNVLNGSSGLGGWTLQAGDNGGGDALCITQVQITVTTSADNSAPTPSCLNPTVQLNGSGTASVTAASLDGGGSDPCGVATVTASPTIFDCTDVGAPVPVTVTFTDNYGNSSNCTAFVTVQDVDDPVITMCASDVMATTDAGQCTATGVALGTPTATDNCSVSLTNDAPAAFPVGSTLVTWTATDPSGNSVTCTQNVTVTDSENPSITCPGLQTLNTTPNQCGVVNPGTMLSMPTTSDNCTVSSVTNDAPALLAPGLHTVVWTVTDASGNTATCNQSVFVQDTEDPVINCPGAPIVLNTDPGVCTAASSSLTPPPYTDNCTTGLTVTNNAPTNLPVGTTVVTWTVTDAAGNDDQCFVTVNVVDNEDPTITCPGPITVNANINGCQATGISMGTPTTSDNCMSGLSTSNDAPASFPMGTTTVTWTVTDAAGNTATCTQDVTVVSGTTVTGTASDATCGESNGSIDITVANDPGITTLSVMWSNGSSMEDQMMIAAGDYTVSVTNSLGCVQTEMYTIAGGITGSSTLAASASCGTCSPTDGNTSVFFNGTGDYIMEITDLTTAIDLGATNACLLMDGSVQTCNGTPYLQRQWQVDVTNNEGATVKVYFTNAEMNNLFAATLGAYPDIPSLVADLTVTGFDGAGEACNDNTSVTTYTPVITQDDPAVGIWSCEFTTTGFTTFTISPGSNPLPVEMSSFVGWNEGRTNQLKWRTETEENTSHFEILRSANGEDFERIGTMTAVGNSAEPVTYDFTDDSPVSGENYYKLRIVDLDDTYEFSETIVVKTGKNNGTIKAFPNPFGQNISFELNATESGNAIFQVFDITGKIAHTTEKAVIEGNSVQQLNLNHLNNGVYLVKVFMPGSNEAISTKIIKE